MIEQEQKIHRVQIRGFPFEQFLAGARNIPILYWLKYEPICFMRKPRNELHGAALSALSVLAERHPLFKHVL